MQHRHFYYGPGTHYSATVSSDDEDDDDSRLDFPATSYNPQQLPEFPGRQMPRANWRGLVSRKSKRTVTETELQSSTTALRDCFHD